MQVERCLDGDSMRNHTILCAQTMDHVKFITVMLKTTAVNVDVYSTAPAAMLILRLSDTKKLFHLINLIN